MPSGPYGKGSKGLFFGRGKGDGGKGSKGGCFDGCKGGKGDSFDGGKGGDKGGYTPGSDDTEQPLTRDEQLERRVYELEGEVDALRRQMRWLLAKLGRVLVLPADDEEPSRH